MWKAGDFVVHSAKPEWGVGKVTKANSLEIEVFFVERGRCLFGQPAKLLDAAPPESATHPLLQKVSSVVLEGKAKFLPLSECITYFEKLFPGGFHGSAYLDPKAERQYKLDASHQAAALLGEAEWARLANEGEYREICHRLEKVESATNLLHTFEKIKWHTALKDESLQKLLCDALFDDLYGSGSRMSRFERLSKALSEADGCAKWTIATYYGLLIHPDSRIFIKPEVTKFAAEACGWDLCYESSLNWRTLSQAEGLAKYLFDELTNRGLKPRDMIDVQSFIWCIDPKSYMDAT